MQQILTASFIKPLASKLDTQKTSPDEFVEKSPQNYTMLREIYKWSKNILRPLFILNSHTAFFLFFFRPRLQSFTSSVICTTQHPADNICAVFVQSPQTSRLCSPLFCTLVCLRCPIRTPRKHLRCLYVVARDKRPK